MVDTDMFYNCLHVVCPGENDHFCSTAIICTVFQVSKMFLILTVQIQVKVVDGRRQSELLYSI